MNDFKANLNDELNKLKDKKINFKHYSGDKLDVDYGILLPKQTAELLFNQLEEEIVYESAENSMLKIFGKWHKIPRKQSAYGDLGTSYKFSGKTVLAKPWLPILQTVKSLLFNITSHNFNFVLINRYESGNDHIGEHRDSEPDLDPNKPIASLSLGQERIFVLKHSDCRIKGKLKRNIPPVKILLEHGSLLLMNPPTNNFWYHSIPIRKSAKNVRINLTFRCIKT